MFKFITNLFSSKPVKRSVVISRPKAHVSIPVPTAFDNCATKRQKIVADVLLTEESRNWTVEQ